MNKTEKRIYKMANNGLLENEDQHRYILKEIMMTIKPELDHSDLDDIEYME